MWVSQKLSDITSKIGSGATPRGGKAAYKEEGMSLIRSMNVHDRQFRSKDLALIDDQQAEKLKNVELYSGDVLLNITGASVARCCVVPDNFLPARVNQHVSIIRVDQDLIDPDFLCLLLTSKVYKDCLLEVGGAGATREAITKTQLQNFEIAFPSSLREQREVVADVDAMFADIDKAKQNAEQNLKNAHELFNSYLQSVFGQKDDGWVEKPFDQVCVLQRGFDLPKRLREPGDYPLVTSSGIKDTHKEAKVSGPGVVTGRSGSIGNVFYVEDNFWPLNTALYIKNFHNNNEKYIYWFLRYFDLSRFSGGTGVPTLNRNLVHGEMVFVLEDTNHQVNIVSRIESLEQEVRQLDVIYKQKIKHLEELKQSILQKAFSGEL